MFGDVPFNMWERTSFPETNKNMLYESEFENTLAWISHGSIHLVAYIKIVIPTFILGSDIIAFPTYLSRN